MQDLSGIKVHGFSPFGHFDGFENIFEPVEDFIQDFLGDIKRGLNPNRPGIGQGTGCQHTAGKKTRCDFIADTIGGKLHTDQQPQAADIGQDAGIAFLKLSQPAQHILAFCFGLPGQIFFQQNGNGRQGC